MDATIQHRSIVVLGDSYCLYAGEQTDPADPRLYPHQIATMLSARTKEQWSAINWSAAGWSVRVAAADIVRDQRLRAVVRQASAIVVGLSSADCLTTGLPLGAGLPKGKGVVAPNVRPRWLRRLLRRSFAWTYPRLVKLSGERFRYTPGRIYRRCWPALIDEVRRLAPQAALCATLPGVHRSWLLGHSNRHYSAGRSETAEMAQTAGVPVVDLADIIRPHLDRLHHDGIHWPPDLHVETARRMTDLLMPQLPATGGGEKGRA
jgi:diglucosylglycerate octanoyltransferase